MDNVVLEYWIQILASAKLKYNINDETLKTLYMVKVLSSIITNEQCLLYLDGPIREQNESSKKGRDKTLEAFVEEAGFSQTLCKTGMCQRQRHFSRGIRMRDHIVEDLGSSCGKNECIST